MVGSTSGRMTKGKTASQLLKEALIEDLIDWSKKVIFFAPIRVSASLINLSDRSKKISKQLNATEYSLKRSALFESFVTNLLYEI